MPFKNIATSGADRARASDSVVPETVPLAFQCLPINLSREEIRALVREALG